MTDLSQLTGDKRRALIAALDNGGAVFGETDILEALGLCETHDGERIPLTALRITPAGRLLAQALRVIHAKEIQNEKARRESAENPCMSTKQQQRARMGARMKPDICVPQTARPVRRGIPTMYQGVLMRSRTEARWAAFFDAVGWAWVYEPFDLERWIPDFLVRLPKADFLVEIKAVDEDFPEAKRKIDATSYDGLIVIAGQDLDGNVLGEIREHDGPGYMWSQLEVFFCLSCGRISPRPVEAAWTCRQCGDGHGNAHIGDYDVQGTFRRASNRVQWRPE